MTINLVRPRKSAVLKHFLRGDSSVSAPASGALQGRARRCTPGWARRRPLPARRHGDANRAPGFKDKAVISDAQQPEGAGRAPCHLTSHYTNALHGAEAAWTQPGPARPKDTRPGLAAPTRFRVCGVVPTSTTTKVVFTLWSYVKRVGILVRSSVLGRNPSAGRKKLT